MNKLSAKDILDYAFFMNAKTVDEAMRYTNEEPKVLVWCDEPPYYFWPKLKKGIIDRGKVNEAKN